MTNRRSLLLIGSLFLCLFSCNLFESISSDQEEVATDIQPTVTEEAAPMDESPEAIASPTTIRPSEIPPSPPTFKIVYTDAGNIWLIDGGKLPIQVTSSGFIEEVLISPDGLRIAFKRRIDFEDLPELWAINADGSAEALLLSSDDMKAFYPSAPESKGFDIAEMAFLPGSHDLIFNTYKVVETVGTAMTDDLLRINTETGELTHLLAPKKGGQFAISPDGTRIVVIQPDSILMIDPDGSGSSTNLITYSPVITYSEFAYYAQPVWARDSAAVGFAIPSEDPLSVSPSGDIWRIPKNGNSALKTATIAGDFYFSQVFSASTLSPYLDKVAFMRETVVPNIRDLYIANSDGSAETIYDTGEISWDGWAPDGIHFVYSIADAMDLVLGAVGDSPSPLVNGTDLRWINNRDFLYLSGSLGSWTLLKGRLGAPPISLATPSGDFIAYDFVSFP
jgi:hypothetical protein